VPKHAEIGYLLARSLSADLLILYSAVSAASGDELRSKPGDFHRERRQSAGSSNPGIGVERRESGGRTPSPTCSAMEPHAERENSGLLTLENMFTRG
jgi:hypothetical protein